MPLLDTNVCIAIMNERSGRVRQRFVRAIGRREPVAVSTISMFELWYGVAKSGRIPYNTDRIATFLNPLSAVPFDDEDARTSGRIRADLERLGTPIGPYDCLIAGQAMRRNLTLVTANVREFARVKGLRWENWAE